MAVQEQQVLSVYGGDGGWTWWLPLSCCVSEQQRLISPSAQHHWKGQAWTGSRVSWKCVCEMRLGVRLTGAWWKAVLIGHWLSLRGVVHTGTDKPEVLCHRSTQLWMRGRQEQNLAVLNCPFLKCIMLLWNEYRIYQYWLHIRQVRTTDQAGGYFQS